MTTVADIRKSTEEKMKKSIESLKTDLQKVRTGRAHTGILDHVQVDYYGSMVPISQVANLQLADARTITVQPWEKNMVNAVEKAIRDSDLNLNPSNNGLAIILSIPPLTEERRRDLVKVVGRMAEEARIAVRNLRHDSMGVYKRQEHDGDMSEDERKRAEKVLQEKVDAVNLEITDLAKKKEDAIMTV